MTTDFLYVLSLEKTIIIVINYFSNTICQQREGKRWDSDILIS